MKKHIEDALSRPPDRSMQFNEKHRNTCLFISQALDIPLHYEPRTNGNYGTAVTIILSLDQEFSPITYDHPDAIYQLTFWLSSRAPFFTCNFHYFMYLLLPHRKTPIRSWISLSSKKHHRTVPPQLTEGLTPEIIAFKESIASHISQFGFELLLEEEDNLLEPLEGYKTTIDGSPACIFQILFSEV